MWPHVMLPKGGLSFNPQFRNARGGAAVAYGPEQIVSSDAGRWVATLASNFVYAPERKRTWMALQVLLQGGLSSVIMPVCPWGGWPFPDGVTELPGSVLHDDDTPHDDDAGYEDGIIDVVTSSAAARRTTTIALTKRVCGDIAPGHEFSMLNRLYRVAEVVTQSVDAAEVRVWPPLREAIEAGATAEFDRPTCMMRLAADNAMDIARAPGVSTADVSFVEDLS